MSANIGHPHEMAQRVLNALGIAEMRNVTSLDIHFEAGCFPVVTVRQVLASADALAEVVSRYTLEPLDDGK